MTTKVIRILFAAVDAKEETVAKMRDIVLCVFKIVYSTNERGKITFSSEKIEDSGLETHAIEVDSRNERSFRFRYRFHLQKDEFIVSENFDVVVLFSSASILFRRAEKEFWLPYLQSFFMRVDPLLRDENVSRLLILYANLRNSGGNYRLQNDVWTTIVVDENDVDENCKKDWQEALSTLKTIPEEQGHFQSWAE